MSKLLDFLTENPVDNVTCEFVIGDRFKDKNGSFMKFKARAMTSKEYASYQKQALKVSNKGKSEFDLARYYELIVINQTLDPNFKDAEAISKASCARPEEFLNKVMLAGEIDTLADKIIKASGFNVDVEELREEAKN